MNVIGPYKRNKLALALLAALVIGFTSGCATRTPTLYNWGNYQQQVYAHFKADTSPAQQIQELEKTLQKGKLNQPIAPGFHAHLGLLYGEVGRTDDMREQFIAEKQLYPESAQFMDFLLEKAESQGVKK